MAAFTGSALAAAMHAAGRVAPHPKTLANGRAGLKPEPGSPKHGSGFNPPNLKLLAFPWIDQGSEVPPKRPLLSLTPAKSWLLSRPLKGPPLCTLMALEICHPSSTSPGDLIPGSE